MRTTLLAGAALTAGLLITTLVWGSAQATSAPDLKSALGTSGAVTLVGHSGGQGGGGRGGMGGGGGGGRAALGGGGGGGRVALGGGGGGGRAVSSRSFSVGSSHFKGGKMAGGNITGGRSFSKHLNSGPGFKGHDRFVANNWKSGKHHDNNHLAMRDHDHNFNHFNRHRVFRNGVWISAYGPDYYAGDDCWWLLRQAQVTGSPYWWSRYNACVSYY